MSAPEPKTLREAGIHLHGLNGRLALISKLTFTILGILVLIASGGFAIYSALNDQISEIKINVALVQQDVKTVQKTVEASAERLAKVEASAGGILAAQNDARASLNRIEARLSQPSAPSIALSAEEIDLLRKYVPIEQKPKAAKARYKLGDFIKDLAIKSFAGELTKRVPRFSELQYAIDDDNSILLVSGSNQVVAVLPPAA